MQLLTTMDGYFDENGFLEWFHKKHNVEQTSFTSKTPT